MLQDLAKKIFGTQNDRELKSIRPLVVRINELENGIKALADSELRGKTIEFKERPIHFPLRSLTNKDALEPSPDSNC